MGGLGPAKLDPTQEQVYPIASLNPYYNKWTIKARVTNKSDIRRWSNERGEGYLFSVDLLDAQGGEIRATMFKSACDMFYDVFEEGKVYMISKAQIRFANKKFNNLNNAYELTLDTSSIVQLVTDEAEIPKMRYSFVKIANLEDVPADTVVDVIGVVVSSADLTQINTRSGSQLSKRTVTVIDETRSSIEFTIWGEKAESWDPAFHG